MTETDAQRALADAQIAIDSLESIISDLERELMDANDLVERQQRQIDDLTAERDGLQKEVEMHESHRCGD